MLLVIDANIFIAAFLKSSSTRKILLNGKLRLFAPESLLLESKKVLGAHFARHPIANADLDFDTLFTALTNHFTVVQQTSYKNHLQQALQLAPHEEDAPYLACALKLNVPLWSNDAGFKKQNVVSVYTTKELMMELSQ